ncbi:hypothetical protein PHLCEN_2v418 [Hermanssonia centrifuga]|uniref:BZIP domain-containing protein n=1 Tax=Hermanssonia centrifuga TaxID=98765 RepID=A0A2R6S640_9APHY|nr:hypothetical protein PHLCEN_2v418 [Hermanssonia centrifuga]
MPQSPQSPSSSKAGSDDNVPGESAQRKKKNADAQAAFRARRANYIATLEDAVTNLEAVVVQLQESLRQSKYDTSNLRTEVSQLRKEATDREKFWRALWQTRNTGMPPDPDDTFNMPSYAQSHSSPGSSRPPSTPSPTMTAATHYRDERLRYSADPSVTLVSPSYRSNHLQQHSPAMGFAGVPNLAPATAAAGHSQALDSQTLHSYTTHVPSYGMDGIVRDEQWSQPGSYASDSIADHGRSDASPSPTFTESPTHTSSELAYGGGDDPKLPYNTAGSSLYMFSPSRSISPASTPTSTSSSLSTYAFTFPEGTVVQDRPEFIYRRPPLGLHSPEIRLHGGQANIPIPAGTLGDALRSKLNGQGKHHPSSMPASYTQMQGPPPESDASSESSASPPINRLRRRRSTIGDAPISRGSRSPSPVAPISGTLAVIKAHTFGALRKTRGRHRTNTDGVVKAAVDALSVHGLGLGIGIDSISKRPRLHQNGGDGMPP